VVARAPRYYPAWFAPAFVLSLLLVAATNASANGDGQLFSPPLPARPASIVTIARTSLLESRGPADDEYLRERFGASFEGWASRVPAFVPNPVLYVRAEQAFDSRAVLRREFYGVAVILIVPFVLDLLEDFLEEGQLALDPVWTPTAVLGVIMFVVLRRLKKSGCRRSRPPHR
jgi:hypothetical protein